MCSMQTQLPGEAPPLQVGLVLAGYRCVARDLELNWEGPRGNTWVSPAVGLRTLARSRRPWYVRPKINLAPSGPWRLQRRLRTLK